MTQLMDQTGSDGAHNYWYYILNPASGTQTVAADTNLACQLAALTYSGVNQTTPFDTNFDGASNGFVKNNNSSVANNTQVTTTGTTHVNNSYAVISTNNERGVVAGTNATERLSNIVFDRGSATSPAGIVSIGILNNSGFSQLIDGFMIALQPAN